MMKSVYVYKQILDVLSVTEHSTTKNCNAF